MGVFPLTKEIRLNYKIEIRHIKMPIDSELSSQDFAQHLTLKLFLY